MSCLSSTTASLIAAALLLTIVARSASADDITTQVFGEYTKFMPAAFGDFNSDKHTDVFIIDKDKKNGSCFVRVMLSYLDPPLLRPDGPNCTCPGNVKSVVPGDFDGDGALDLMMLSVQSEGLYDVYVAWGNLKNLTCPTEKVASVHGQPLMMDYNGDMIADLFGESDNGTRSFWLFNARRSPPDQVPLVHTATDAKPLPPLRFPSSHAFVDLDGDLAADLFVTAEGQFEIWTNAMNGFYLTETIPIPKWVKVVGQTTFMDISLSGRSELITVLCKEPDCSDGQIYVWTRSSESNEMKFVPVGFPLLHNEVKWSYPTNSHRAYPYTDTITLRVADHDLDGYPDLLVTLIDASGNPQVLLVWNRPCSDQCGVHSRRMEPAWDLFTDYPKSVMAAFFDVYEDGRVDILLLHQDKDNAGQYVVAAITDTQQYDAMFLKVLVPSGRCYSECPHHSLPYGTSPPGPTFRYSITTGDRSMQVSVATQLSQSAHMALQLPYTLFGLGRNWNFVETLEVGLAIKDTPAANHGFYRNQTGSNVLVSLKRKRRQSPDYDYSDSLDDSSLLITSGVKPSSFPSVRNFTQIIPNSQVIVIPYPLDQPDHWVNKLYITPSKALKLTAAALLVICFLVALVIAVLHYREKKEDRKEKLQQAQTFHFDAM